MVLVLVAIKVGEPECGCDFACSERTDWDWGSRCGYRCGYGAWPPPRDKRRKDGKEKEGKKGEKREGMLQSREKAREERKDRKKVKQGGKRKGKT